MVLLVKLEVVVNCHCKCRLWPHLLCGWWFFHKFVLKCNMEDSFKLGSHPVAGWTVAHSSGSGVTQYCLLLGIWTLEQLTNTWHNMAWERHHSISLIHFHCIRVEVRKYKVKRVGKKEDCFTYNQESHKPKVILLLQDFYLKIFILRFSS